MTRGPSRFSGDPVFRIVRVECPTCRGSTLLYTAVPEEGDSRPYTCSTCGLDGELVRLDDANANANADTVEVEVEFRRRDPSPTSTNRKTVGDENENDEERGGIY